MGKMQLGHGPSRQSDWPVKVCCQELVKEGNQMICKVFVFSAWPIGTEMVYLLKQ